MGRRRSFCFSPMQLFLFFSGLLLIPTLSSISSRSDREALEIGIGIGIGGGPPPPEAQPRMPPSSPQRPRPQPQPQPQPRPCDFENILQYRAYFVIQRFKRTITCDPMNKTNTWRGFKLCNNDGDGYQGFYCETPPNRKNMRTIASVDFNGFKLGAPTVSRFVDQLPDLALFHANSNNLGGTVPFLRTLPFFYELDISNNDFSGGFPVNVLPLVNLSFLDLRYNSFASTLPPSVFLIQTQVLFLNNNKFYQQIPANLGSTPAAYITFAYNDFTGPIPSSIGKACETLIEILFLGNRLSGCLPYEVGLLKKATVFDAGSNQLTGPIPLSFGCLVKVEQLNLAGNQLCGEVPDVVCRLAKYGNLVNLSLSDNYFTSVAPSCISLIHSNVLDVRKNCIPWLPHQRSPEECAWFLKLPRVFCPNAQIIPCHLPWEGRDELDSSASSSPAVDGGRDKSPASGYTTYKALHHHDKP
ncbi:hypothetical protein C4D60_Mb08t19480 [Musa balbisiana]|uniref:Leucine-rich repeat-containing N-terminal plant-type domain-containing protein n=1 Tax=Musa balbisiana TaxID=52838 RepID=A0A4S8K544_MUSBA|nr:hypothetical protein C4D60_Mb08t19480 [Musa balbisiana]